jgi:DNA polymerase-3 subunit alpha
MSKNLNFTHLHLHTEYSMLDGANKVKALAQEAKKLGMHSIAITDHGNMFGAIEFYTTMKKEGIKPIIGMEAYLHNHENIGDKSSRRRFHICLYAKNDIGYKNLMYLSSISYLEGFYYDPRINKDTLKENCEGLICSSACLQGEINWHLNTQNEKNIRNGSKGYEEAKKVALEYKEMFGDDFYLEIMRHGIGDQYFIDQQVLKIAKECNIKVIATNDTHYLNKDYADAHEVFMCIAMNKELDDPNRMKHDVHEFYLKSPEDMARLYADIPEAIENTNEIAQKCNLEIKLGNPTPPNFQFVKEYAQDEGLDIDNDADYFVYKSKQGLEERLKHVPTQRHQEYKDRLDFEINIINNMKFPGYMLIVWDFVREAKKQDIPVGPGRGSAAGSLVAYCLEITNIDPMKYDLLFERFLNPERVSMPDIDMDFCQSRRQDIIDYVTNKYGRNNVAQIVTFGKLLAKGVIRDVARVLGMEYNKADAMAKLIPKDLGIDLAKSFEKEPKIKELIDSDKDAKRVWDYSLKLEGLNRNSGTHAAGVVISNEELWKKTPLYKLSSAPDAAVATQYNLKYIEDVDLIKFDFLGLKTLTVIDNALKLIKRRYNKDIDFTTMEMDDPQVYKLIQSGHTIGLFQIESKGMQELNSKLKPSNFEEIIAVLALYRPGPMDSGMLDDFIDRKHGRAPVDYFHDEFEEPLKPILEPTYGVIVYQEQVMQIVQTIGGFSLGGADLVRRAMGKKIKEEMDRLKSEFADGGVKKGYKKENCEELFDLIVKFAGYGFNKSHSAAYAMITYQTSYLKTHYPQEFLAALITSDQDNTDKVVRYIDEVKRLGIKLLPPNVNLSYSEFSATKIDDEDVILFGMGALKGAGGVAIDIILKARLDGNFTDLSDFINRIDAQKVNKKVLETLIKAGALDEFGYSRKALFENVEYLVDMAKKSSELSKQNEFSLFGDTEEMSSVNVQIQNQEEYSLKEVLELEKETMGIYVSGHPLDEFRDSINTLDYTKTNELQNIENGSKIMLVGKILEAQEKTSKKGNKFAILTFMDFYNTIEIMLFERLLPKLDELDFEEPIAIIANINKKDDEDKVNINIQKLLPLSKAKKEKTSIQLKPLHIFIDTNNIEKITNFSNLAKENVGQRELVLYIDYKDDYILKLDTNFQVNNNFIEVLKTLDFIKEVRK